MRLLFILPTAGFTCLSGVRADESATSLDERNNLRRERSQRNTTIRKQMRGLNIFNERQFLNPNRSTKKPIPKPTRRPSKRPTKNPLPKPTRRPTKKPTRKPTKKPTLKEVPALIPASLIEPPTRPFRLKLYWQESYQWQDFRQDPKFCMECSGSDMCFAGNLIYPKYCSESAVDQPFTAIGTTIRPLTDISLCFTVMGYKTVPDTDGELIPQPIEIQKCGEDDRNQQFLMRSLTDDSFEISPIDRPERCLASAHHPKLYEKMHARSCSDSRVDTTSSWIFY